MKYIICIHHSRSDDINESIDENRVKVTHQHIKRTSNSYTKKYRRYINKFSVEKTSKNPKKIHLIHNKTTAIRDTLFSKRV